MRSLRFFIALLLALLLSGALHASYFYANEMVLPFDALIICYGANFIMAAIVYAVLLLLAQRQSAYLGFFFLFGSAFKFIVYFLIIEPLLKQDGTLSYADFFLFFIPYLISLILETLAVINLLKSSAGKSAS